MLDAAEDAAPDLRLAAELVERRQFQHLGVLDVLYAVVGKLVEQSFQHRAGLLAIFAEDVALLDLVGALAAGQRFLVKSDVSDEIEGIELAAVGYRLLAILPATRHALPVLQAPPVCVQHCSSGAESQ